jgi:hypothetical protein
VEFTCFFSLDCAWMMPTVMAAGSAGGTTMVIRSSERSTILLIGQCLWTMTTTVKMKPMEATPPKNKMNAAASLGGFHDQADTQ